jgi:diguanylate cyclase (GGDEF)-like protein/PAS domain S-box-containing protein
LLKAEADLPIEGVMHGVREVQPMWVPGDDAYRRLAESVEDVAVILLDPKGSVVSWNRGAEKLKGYAAEEILGKPFSLFYPVEATEVGHPQRELEAAAAMGHHAEEGWRVRKDGSRFWAHVVITAIHDENGDIEGFGKLARDLTPVKQAEEQRARAFALLEATAATDSLTGLANRRAWDERVEQEGSRCRQESKPLCIAVLDLDHFKSFNDEFGHREGDQFLRRCAMAWRKRLRPPDILARYGGEEFALCLPQIPLEEAAPIVERLRRSTPPDRTCSAGLAEWDGVEPLDRLFGRADQALYDAKAAGRDRTMVAEMSSRDALMSVVS